ncbi:MAG: vWA domain-containing protein [Desulforhopalus sp.]
MNFDQPLWLLAGIGACTFLALLFRFLQKKRWAALESFASHHLLSRLTRNVSSTKRRYKTVLLLAGVLMCFIALARPQYGHKWVEVKRKGIDLLFALDTSKSMLAEDIKPYRLKRAQLAILDFVRQLQGDRVGLMPFAGSAYLMCPLTLDYEAFERSLNEVTTNIIPLGGTNIGNVIDKAAETLNNDANHKILIILTDGENLEGNALAAADNAKKQGVTIYTVGVGTSEGELIPLPGGSNKGFVKDTEGNFVTSRLDETTLKGIAERGSGLYVPLGTAGEGLEKIYQEKLSLVPKEELADRRHKVPLERFQWPLATAILFLVLELFVGDRKKQSRIPFFRKFNKPTSRGVKATSLLLLITFSLARTAHASTGEEAFRQGDYLKASEYYSGLLKDSPDNPQLHFNFGTAAYKNNMYDDAIDAFTKTLKSDDVKLQEKAYYNMGNSYYAKGEETIQANPQATADQWRQALASLQAAIKLDPEDKNALHNHEIITKRLEELEKQLEKQKKQQDQQQDNEQQSNNEKGQSKEQKQSGNSTSKQDNSQGDGEQQRDEQSKPQEGSRQPQEENRQQQQAKQQGEEKSAGQIAENSTPTEEDRQAEQTSQDKARQQLGKMTREEAERLLNALKNEEGELNFVPSVNNDTPAKDW